MKKFIGAVLIFLATFMGLGYAQSESKEVAPPAPAANISLYEQPDAKSKVIEAITPGRALIPIFSQGNWLKVADPTNGQVGWINNETLPAQNRVYVKTITQSTNTPNKNSSQVIQYSGNEQLDEKQLGQLMQNLQNRQAELQQVFDQLFNQSVVNFNALLRQLNQQTSRPWVLPGQTVIISPEAKTAAPSAPASESQSGTNAPSAPQVS
ncbi:MAG TPA: SH3 domain-containing protein [Gammaproteobacteria bacterium]|nr:SH3 domain-containing protein [Gammaproteobacteria bacterium]